MSHRFRYFYRLATLAGLLFGIILTTSGCTQLSESIVSTGNYIGRKLGFVDEGTRFTREEQRKQVLAMITAEQEYHLGRAVAAQILHRFAALEDPELQRYIQLIGQALAARNSAVQTFGGYHFKVIKSSNVNAISAPGGYVFITTGFLDELQSEDQLAAILAHEIAHIGGRHGIQMLQNSAALDELSLLGLASGGLNCAGALVQATTLFSHLVDNLLDTLLESGYSHDLEYEADAGAFVLLRESGYQSLAIHQALEVLQRTLTNGQGSGGWFSTHPSVDDRQEQLRLAGDLSSAASGDVESVRTERFLRYTKGT